MKDTKTDLYRVLGVAIDAEIVVIKAAYKALIKMYHPDKEGGNVNKTKELNEAYEILIDSIRRQEYDKSLTIIEELNSTFTKDLPFSQEPLEEEWSIASSFHPEANNFYEMLAKISYQLAFNFKLLLLEQKNFKDAAKIFKHMRKQYLSKYFGTNDTINNFAERLILLKERVPLLALNKMISVVGDSTYEYQIINAIYEKFPTLKDKIKKVELTQILLSGDADEYQIVDYGELFNLVVKQKGFFTSTWEVKGADIFETFDTKSSTVRFLLNNYPVF